MKKEPLIIKKYFEKKFYSLRLLLVIKYTPIVYSIFIVAKLPYNFKCFLTYQNLYVTRMTPLIKTKFKKSDEY